MLNWYPRRKSLAYRVLDRMVDVNNRFIVIGKKSHNATSAFIKYDLIEECSRSNAVPILLPCIDECFTEKFCTLVWNLYKNDATIVEQFCKNQTRYRSATLKKEIEDIHTSNNINKVPSIGLHDAYQILNLSSEKVVLISGESALLFTTKYQYLVTGIEIFLQQSKNAIAVLVVPQNKDSMTKKEKMYQITAYHLPNISSEQYIDHAIKTAKKVSPHLSISIAKVISFDAMCNNIEEFINEIQDVVLYQKLDLAPDNSFHTYEF